MKYVDFKERLKDFMVFSLGDVRKIDPRFHRRRLNEWQDKGYIKKIIRGYYIFADQEANESVLFVIANRIYDPSYISFEMALSYYSLIPESVYSVTSASSKKTCTFLTPLCRFDYRKIKPALMFGYRLIIYGRHSFKIADPEKALLDFLYLNPQLKSKNDFKQLRFNRKNLIELINTRKLMAYLRPFGRLALKRRAIDFLKYA